MLQELLLDINWVVLVVSNLLLLLTSGATVFTYVVYAHLEFGLLVLCWRSCMATKVVCKVHECIFPVTNCSFVLVAKMFKEFSVAGAHMTQNIL